MHPWHHVSWTSRSLNIVPVVIQVPMGSRLVYSVDRGTGLLNVDRVSDYPAPCNFGLVPRTCSEEGDPLEALVLSGLAPVPLSVVKARPLGFVRVEGRAPFLVGVQWEDPVAADGRGEMTNGLMDAIRHFLRTDSLPTFSETLSQLTDAVNRYRLRYGRRVPTE